MHCYVVGVNGSGKTTLLKRVQELSGIKTIAGTAALMDYLGIEGDYDALRAMDQAYVLQKWAATARKLIHEYADESFLLDTHIMNLTHGHYIRRDGPWIKDYDMLILVKADPKTILDRVMADGNRDRALFAKNTSLGQKATILADYQEQTEALFRQLAKEYNLPSKVIINNDLEHAAQEFVSIFS